MNRSNFARLFFAVSTVGATAGAHATTVDIQLNFFGKISSTQKAIVQEAANFWETNITGYQDYSGLEHDPIAIDVFGAGLDGPGKAWGAATKYKAVPEENFVYATEGRLVLDVVDLDYAEGLGALLPLAMHEIAHILGFGVLWSSSIFGIPGYQEVYVPGSGQYTGSYALEAYRATVDPNAAFIPVELDLGPGSNDSHWDEDFGCPYFGCDPELMTASLEPGWFVSDYTIASFADIGYTTSVTHPQLVQNPLPQTIWMFLSALGLLTVPVLKSSRKIRTS